MNFAANSENISEFCRILPVLGFLSEVRANSLCNSSMLQAIPCLITEQRILLSRIANEAAEQGLAANFVFIIVVARLLKDRAKLNAAQNLVVLFLS
jgi:hypothetical protein